MDKAIRILEAEEGETVKVGKETWKADKQLLNSKKELWTPRNIAYTYNNYGRLPRSPPPRGATHCRYFKTITVPKAAQYLVTSTPLSPAFTISPGA